jgi:FkbM family methyltransferase
MDHHDVKNFEYLGKLLNENSIVVDVGAHLGVYTNFFTQIIKDNGKIYSIELNPSTFNRLQNTYSTYKNITLLNKAVSNTDGIVDFYHDGGHTQTTNILGFDANRNINDKIGSIESIRLDTLLNKEDNIDLIKIDVEGAEIKVLEGLSGVVSKVSHLLVECHLDEDWSKIKNILINQYNFSCYDVQFDSAVNIDTKERSYQCLCKKIT